MPNELRTIRDLATVEPCLSLGLSYAWLYTLTATLNYIPNVFKDGQYFATLADVTGFLARHKVTIRDARDTQSSERST